MSRPIPARYAVAASVVGLVMLIKSPLEARFGVGPPLIFFVPAVTFGAWYGGLGPGLLVVALSSIVCIYFYFSPIGSLMIGRPNDLLRLTLFLLEGFMTCVLMEQLHFARRQSELSAEEAERYRDTLRESEERLQAMMDNSTALVYLKDADGRYLLMNRQCEAFLGLHAQQAIGKTDLDIFPRGIAEVFQVHDRDILESGKAMEWEDTLPLPGGERIFLTSKFPLRQAGGKPSAVGGFSTEITGRKRAEMALRASEERFRSLSACSPVGIYLTDVAGRCTYVNPRCRDIFGFTSEEALGDGWSRYIHPEDRSWVMEQWVESVRLGQVFSREYRTLGPSGGARWVHDRSASVVSERGELLGHVGTVEDITDRKRAEDAVRRERDFAERLIETAQAYVLVLDSRGRVVRFNPFLQHVMQWPPEQLLGADWFATFVAERDRPGARAAFERALTGDGGRLAIHSIVNHEGRESEVEWASQALAGVVGDTSGVLAIGHDITRLKEAQMRALQAERLAAIGQMVAGLAHESRNALQRGKACLEMLALRLKDRPEALDLVAGSQQALNDLHHLYEEVRNYAAPIRLDRRPCRLRKLLHEAWSRLGPMREGRDARLHEGGDPDPTCEGDPFRLTQVFRNILENALAACHDPVEIDVDWTQADLDGWPAVRAVVRDNGPGFTAEQRRNLFEPFYTTKTQGTGLGMAIVRRIVEAHGGLIAAGPDGDRGATILILLPRESS